MGLHCGILYEGWLHMCRIDCHGDGWWVCIVIAYESFSELIAHVQNWLSWRWMVGLFCL